MEELLGPASRKMLPRLIRHPVFGNLPSRSLNPVSITRLSSVYLSLSKFAHQHSFSSSSRTPTNAPYDGGSVFGQGPPPVSYFSSRPALPANTIIRFVPQQTAWIVERMGRFNRILEPGLAILVPFLDKIAYVKSLKESAIEIPSQNAITADNVTLELDGVLYTRVFDAYKARYIYKFH